MSFNTLKNINDELEHRAKMKLSTMTKGDIEFQAEQHRSKLLKQYTGLAIVFSIVVLAMVACIPLLLYSSEEDMPTFVWFLFSLMIVCFVGEIIYFIVQIVCIRKKSGEDILFVEIQKEVAQSLRAQLLEERIKNNTGSDFIISKTIPVKSNGFATQQILIDNVNKKFIYQNGKTHSKTYSFSDLINYEVYENGKSQVQGRAGSALIGGAFFGLGGLIVGSSMSRNVNEKCNQLKLIIRLNDFDCPEIVITYVNTVDLDKNSWTYKNMKNNIQTVCSMLEYMLNEKTLEQSSAGKQEEKISVNASSKEQLQELKEMLDDGLITQEDYEKKKKQILGL